MLAKKLMGSAGGTAADKLYVDDVFSTYLYTGNGSTQTITNGIDLAGKGGLVWVKKRTDVELNALLDSARNNFDSFLQTDATNAAQSVTWIDPSSTGFVFGGTSLNSVSHNYVSWTFRKAPKFFDVQTKSHTNGVASTVDLSTLDTVGMVVVKATSTTSNWYTWHRSLTAGNNLKLNLTDAQSATNAYLSVSGTTLTIASTAPTATYIVYAFAHDTAADGMIQCGSFTTDASGNATVTLGWEPQFLMLKQSNGTSDWMNIDSMRGWSNGGNAAYLMPNNSSAESADSFMGSPTATGFTYRASASQTYIYLAIRRPNKPPTSGTGVYNAIARTGTGAAATVTGVGFAPDTVFVANRPATQSASKSWFDRLRGPLLLLTSQTTNAELSYSGSVTSFHNDGVTLGTNVNVNVGTPYINHFFRRAPGFFDVVCYTGTGVSRTVNHNLGAVPELMIVKSRSTTGSWRVYDAINGATGMSYIESTSAWLVSSVYWNDTAPTYSLFTLGTAPQVNGAGATFVAYLFASCPNVSKVGSYTGNGTSQTINCGFSAGARFVLIKATSTTGSWWIYDNARGIVSANDPALQLNSTAAEITTVDAIDPDPSGFIVNQEATCSINANGVSYVFLAIS